MSARVKIRGSGFLTGGLNNRCAPPMCDQMMLKIQSRLRIEAVAYVEHVSSNSLIEEFETPVSTLVPDTEFHLSS